MEQLLTGLRAAAEPTRLRLMALCAEADLTVSDLTAILGQSQPRVSRHLKLLCESGLLERFPEGSRVFHRLVRDSAVACQLVALIPRNDPQKARDRARLAEITRDREAAAADYFARNARHWDAIRRLHVPEGEVETQLLGVLADGPVGDLLDIGTGTGRMLEVFGPHVGNAVGIDLSRDMLAVARVNLDRAQLKNCSVRQADMYALPFAQPGFDLVILNQVLHFAERPGEAVLEAARVLRPGGTLLIADFAPHQLEELRDRHAHRRLGFTEAELTDWAAKAGLAPEPAIHLAGDPLTVIVGRARRPAAPARYAAAEPPYLVAIGI